MYEPLAKEMLEKQAYATQPSQDQSNAGIIGVTNKRSSILAELKSHRDYLFKDLAKIQKRIDLLESNPNLCNIINDYRDYI